MREVYLGWHELAMEALRQEVANPREYKDVDRIVVLGMGGSGIAGDLVALTGLETGSAFVTVVKDFYVPKPVVNDRTLVLAISYSGNTRETLLSLELCSKRTSKIVAVSSGGLLEEYAMKRGIPFVKVRRGLAPRTALPALYAAAMKGLLTVGVSMCESSTLERWFDVLKEVRKAEFDAASLASFLRRARMPLIVASARYAVLATRIKNELNENAKMPAKVEIAPELFHNDIVGWERKLYSDRAIVVESDIPYEVEYLKLYTEILTDVGFEVEMLRLIGDGVVPRVLYGSLVAGLASVKVAEIAGIDPLATKSIAAYKSFINNMEGEIRRTLGLSD
ncbi:MAG: bifunctional phosphoglucose/phosphomannose isomerase [Crenarchaeota archaeon]|nr:bifunctional phosphoglucose/phosphomannose isomerase [Thermoproteota archaeon]